MQLFTTPLQKDTSNSEKEAVEFISTASCVMQNHPMKKLHAASLTKLFFSDKRYDLGEVGRYRINKKLVSTFHGHQGAYQRGYHFHHKYLIELSIPKLMWMISTT
jgi:hypothetical protein